MYWSKVLSINAVENIRPFHTLKNIQIKNEYILLNTYEHPFGKHPNNFTLLTFFFLILKRKGKTVFFGPPIKNVSSIDILRTKPEFKNYQN